MDKDDSRDGRVIEIKMHTGEKLCLTFRAHGSSQNEKVQASLALLELHVN